MGPFPEGCKQDDRRGGCFGSVIDYGSAMNVAASALGASIRSVFGERENEESELKVNLPRAKADDDDKEKDDEELKVREFPFNPYTDALRASQEIEKTRRVVSALETSATFSLLGSHINVLA